MKTLAALVLTAVLALSGCATMEHLGNIGKAVVEDHRAEVSVYYKDQLIRKYECQANLGDNVVKACKEVPLEK